MKPFTICYITSRSDPKAEWFVDSLAAQMKGHRIQLIFLDYLSWHQPDQRSRYFNVLCRGKGFESVTVSPPKPSVYQGPNRKTKNEFFAAANMRNTGFVLCKTENIVFVDDLSILAPGWLDNAYYAAEKDLICLGAYCKADNVDCVDGQLTPDLETIIRKNPQHLDSRYHHGDSGGIGPGYGGWFFGCSFAGTIEGFSAVDGFDESCDSLSFEDVTFGLRLENAGKKIHYNRNMMTVEHNTLHFAPGNAKMIRFDAKQDRELNQDPWSVIDEEHPPQWLKGGHKDYSHFALHWAQNNKKPYFNEHTLKEQRTYYLTHGRFMKATQPERSFQTGQLLEDM